MRFHLLFEQSGTFKNVLKSLGHDAIDYDIDDQFGETDVKIDLFKEIDDAYECLFSIFDGFTKDDIIIAFFPCTYFENQNELIFRECHFGSFSCDKLIDRLYKRALFHSTLLKLVSVVERNGFKMILENPRSNYLDLNFRKPTIIDNNRTLRGDYYIKPTWYWFFNLTPTYNTSYCSPSQRKTKVHQGPGIERSLISPEYAKRFLCDFVFGLPIKNTMIDLFSYETD